VVSEPRLNPNADIKLLLLGLEQHPLLVVDDLLLNPELLLQWAAKGEVFTADPANFYPGVRKVTPGSYAELLSSFIQNQFANIPALAAQTKVSVRQTALAITNQDPSTLLPIQRIPHFDSCDPKQWAMVHYLCSEEYGGTGFFRHCSSGFESITADRQRKYQRLLADDAVTKGLPQARYLQGGSSLFELTHKVEAKFNRALFYPSNLLHSGLINHWQSSQIGQCRLTANCFLHLS
jgi:hypothetical protein